MAGERISTSDISEFWMRNAPESLKRVFGRTVTLPELNIIEFGQTGTTSIRFDVQTRTFLSCVDARTLFLSCEEHLDVYSGLVSAEEFDSLLSGMNKTNTVITLECFSQERHEMEIEALLIVAAAVAQLGSGWVYLEQQYSDNSSRFLSPSEAIAAVSETVGKGRGC